MSALLGGDTSDDEPEPEPDPEPAPLPELEPVGEPEPDDTPAVSNPMDALADSSDDESEPEPAVEQPEPTAEPDDPLATLSALLSSDEEDDEDTAAEAEAAEKAAAADKAAAARTVAAAEEKQAAKKEAQDAAEAAAARESESESESESEPELESDDDEPEPAPAVLEPDVDPEELDYAAMLARSQAVDAVSGSGSDSNEPEPEPEPEPELELYSSEEKEDSLIQPLVDLERANSADDVKSKLDALEEEMGELGDSAVKLQQMQGTPRTPHSQYGASLHLSGEEKRSRERHAILHSLQQAMQAKRHVFGHGIQDPAHVFAAFDTDGSGSVSPDELFQALKRLGLGLSEEQIGRLAAFLDVDGDGEIDYAELLGFLHGEGGNVAAAAAYDAANLQQQSSRAYSPRSPHPPAPTVQQSPWRVQLAMRAVEEADAEEHRVAASKLQARWRGISTRRAIEDGNWEALPVDWLQAELVHPGTPSDLITIGANGGWEAAETVQRNYRGHVDRKKVRHIRETAAATRVQKVHRGRSERQRRHEEAQKANHIQKHYRGAQGRRSAAAKLERESGASQTIQRVQRGKRGRARFETVQRERIEEEARAARQQQLEEASTVTIQANYRGAHTRARISELAHPPRYQVSKSKICYSTLCVTFTVPNRCSNSVFVFPL